jgi:hypothetical protein
MPSIWICPKCKAEVEATVIRIMIHKNTTCPKRAK